MFALYLTRTLFSTVQCLLVSTYTFSVLFFVSGGAARAAVAVGGGSCAGVERTAALSRSRTVLAATDTIMITLVVVVQFHTTVMCTCYALHLLLS